MRSSPQDPGRRKRSTLGDTEPDLLPFSFRPSGERTRSEGPAEDTTLRRPLSGSTQRMQFAGRRKPTQRVQFAGRRKPTQRVQFAGRRKPTQRVQFAGRRKPTQRVHALRRHESWWRRGDSNPGPKMLRADVYVCSYRDLSRLHRLPRAGCGGPNPDEISPHRQGPGSAKPTLDYSRADAVGRLRHDHLTVF